MGMIFALMASSLMECACCMGLSCFSSLFSASLSNMARFGHFLMLFTLFTIAVLAGLYLPDKINQYNDFTGLHLYDNCDIEYEGNCFYRQMIYRASFSLVAMYTFLLLLAGASDTVNRGLWIPKFGLTILLFGALFWVDNSYFAYWAEVCRVMSFLWLLIQGLLLIDFASDLHDLLMPSAYSTIDDDDSSGSCSSSRTPYIVYLLVSMGALAAAVTGLVHLFSDFTACQLGMGFTIATLLTGVLTTILSITDCVGKGILSPCLLFAYSVFMCWYALLSNPLQSCNPTAQQTDDVSENVSVVIVACVSGTVLLYCVFNGSRILSVLDPEGEGVIASYRSNSSSRNQCMDALLTGSHVPVKQEGDDDDDDHRRSSSSSNRNSGAITADGASSGGPKERMYFQGLLILAACYCAMILTNWGKPNGSVIAGEEEGAVTGNESMWLKIVSQWVFIVLHLRVLFVAYLENNEA